MPVTAVTKDLDACTLIIRAEFAAPVERVWALYEDPRQLEKVWGPPLYPATFVDHDLQPGGRSTYYMTSPEGERFGGYMEFLEVERLSHFVFRDGFADGDGDANPELPVSQNTYAFQATADGTAATFTSVYESAEAMQTVLAMGVEEGATSAINQIDGYLATNP